MRYLLVLFIFASPAWGDDIFRCDGVITNRPCGSTPLPVSRSVSPVSPEASRKQKLLHDLSTKAFKAKREYKIDIPIARAESSCSEAATLEDCSKVVEEISISIEERIDARKQIAQSENKEQQNSNQENVAVSIVQNNIVSTGRHRRSEYPNRRTPIATPIVSKPVPPPLVPIKTPRVMNTPSSSNFIVGH